MEPMERLDHLGSPERSRTPGATFAMGLICGALAGATLALLFAPKPGSDMRHQVADSAARMKRRASDAYDGAAHAVNRVAERGRRAYEAGRDAFQQTRAATSRPVKTSVS
jgi:gas vesicle protein